MELEIINKAVIDLNKATEWINQHPRQPFIIRQKLFKDERGWFTELFNEKEFNEKTQLDMHFIQDNMSCSKMHIGRGLHWQMNPHAQTKLVRVVEGEILDYVVGIEPGTEEFGKVYEFHLKRNWVRDDKAIEWLFVPKGFAHGFITLQDSVVQYKVDYPWVKEAERCINMEDLIAPTNIIHYSEKDSDAPTFKEYFSKYLS